MADIHPTPVCPAVRWEEFVHPDDEEGPGGVVKQKETSICLPLIVFLCPYQGIGGHIAVIVTAEVLMIVHPAIWIYTSEVKSLTFDTGNSCGSDTDQSYQLE